MIRFDVALFDVDTREPSVDGKQLIFRARVEPIRSNLERLLAFSSGPQRLTVSTTCLNAAPIENAMADTVRLVRMNEVVADWSHELCQPREFFLEKQSLGCSEENRCQCAFDVFRWNPNAQRLVKAAGASVWCVFGVSLENCVQSTALGLLNLGQTVAVVRDAVLPGRGGEPDLLRTLHALHSRGAQISSTEEFLQIHA